MRRHTSTLQTALIISLVAGLLSTVAAPALLAAEVDLATSIKNVKVYRNRGAVVTRTGIIDAGAGNHTVTISNLPADIDLTYGIRARFIDNDGRITQVKLDEQFTEGSNTAAQRSLLAQIEELELATHNDQSKIEALNVQLRFVEGMSQRTGNTALTDSDLDNAFATLEKTLEFVATNSGKIITERSSLNNTIRKRAGKIQALRHELAQTGNVQKSYTEATLSLSKAIQENATLEFSYLINNANWTLEADAELDSPALKTTVTMFAVVEQNSGEDWLNVPLSLSTTQISSNIQASTPYPVYYNLTDTRVRKLEYMRSSPAAVSDEMLEVKRGGNASSPRFAESAFDAEFILNTPVTINSGGTQQRIEVAKNTSDTALSIRTTPAYGNDAFLYANAKFTGIPTISNPNVTIIRDGTFIGRGSWPDLVSGKALDLPFGSYERVDVKTVILPTEDGKSGIFNKRRVDEEKKQYIVTNNHSAPLTVEVFGVMPQALNEDIEIETLRGATSPTDINIKDRPGVVMWRKTLAAGEVWTVNHWLRTSYPADMRLTGK